MTSFQNLLIFWSHHPLWSFYGIKFVVSIFGPSWHCWQSLATALAVCYNEENDLRWWDAAGDAHGNDWGSDAPVLWDNKISLKMPTQNPWNCQKISWSCHKKIPVKGKGRQCVRIVPAIAGREWKDWQSPRKKLRQSRNCRPRASGRIKSALR